MDSTSGETPLSPSRRSMAHSTTSPLGSSSIGPRPFLNLLNPLSGRNYRGYEQATQEVLEEDEEEEEEEDDRGEGGSRQPRGASWMQRSQPASRIRMQSVRVETPTREMDEEEDDGEVPQSFMIETRGGPSPGKGRGSSSKAPTSPNSPRQYRKAQRSGISNARQPVSMPPRPSDLQSGPDYQLPPPNTASSPTVPKRGLDAYERALWNWVNVYNLDAFLQEVYAYYTGKGIYCIALSKGLNLLTIGFVIGFSTFLLGCVDYSLLPGATHLSDVIVPQCVSKFSGFTFLFFVSFGAFWIWNIVTFVFGIMRLLDMHRFYTYLLDIPDADIQTISWPEIVRRIGRIRESNPVTAISSAAFASDSVTAPLDAHDIANRIMRQENYLIALFNKELLNLHFPLPPALQPLLGGYQPGEEGKGRTLTKALEWNLRFCLLGYLFDEDGRVRKPFVTQKNRKLLIDGLRRRFIFMGCLNAIFAPFIVLYLLMYSFFRYFEEYHKNPSSIGGRQYTPFAQWKFREFNELPHVFTRRLHLSYPAASEYIDQFPNEKVAIVMKFVSFIVGSFAAVLALALVVDPDHFLSFEITPHRTLLFYLGVFGSVVAVARGMIPEDHRVFDTEDLIREVIKHTHYMPSEWKNKLHSQTVHKDFGQLFNMKLMNFITELLSVLLTPFILWSSLPDCSPAIIDFFREFSVHVDGLGYVCSFAVFDFKRHGNVNFGAPTETTDERYMSKEGKMEKSFLNFKAANPDWNPTDPSGSMYLSRIADLAPVGQQSILAGAGPLSRRQARLGSILASSEHRTAMLAQSTFRGAQPATQEQRNAERARMYDSALQKSVAAKRARPVAATPVQAAVGAAPAPLAEEVLSELGDSYIDGVAPHRGLDDGGAVAEGEDDLIGGGVMGMLTQIYDQRRRGL